MEKIPDNIHPSWHEYLQPLFDDPKMVLIKNSVLPRCMFYPNAALIFRAFRMPMSDVKVVILGQDPYHNGSANGLAFAVDKRTAIPKSLQIIRNEIVNSGANKNSEVDIDSTQWRTLEHWGEQGVLLLNTALTVEVGKPDSHTGQWQWFTREVIKIISENQKPVWLLWGAKAKSFKQYIDNFYVPPKITSDTLAIDINFVDGNIVLEADHPAAETYPGSKYKFTGCGHFTLCNVLLNSRKQEIINW